MSAETPDVAGMIRQAFQSAEGRVPSDLFCQTLALSLGAIFRNQERQGFPGNPRLAYLKGAADAFRVAMSVRSRT